MKFSNEDYINFTVWDEDITEHDKMYEEVFSLKELKDKKGDFIVPLKNDKGEKKGQINCKYTTSNFKVEPVVKKESPKKQSEKVIKKE